MSCCWSCSNSRKDSPSAAWLMRRRLSLEFVTLLKEPCMGEPIVSFSPSLFVNFLVRFFFFVFSGVSGCCCCDALASLSLCPFTVSDDASESDDVSLTTSPSLTSSWSD